MKFLCHNCGFSAEIPKAIGTCPMCGSTNTGYEEEQGEEASALPPAEPAAAETPDDASRSQRPSPEQTVSPSVDMRNRNASLSEEFFNKKPYQEEHEIAELLQELGAEDPRPKKKPFPLWSVLGGALVVLLVAGAVLYLVLTPLSTDETGGRSTLPAAVSEPEAKPEPVPEVEPEPAPEPDPVPEAEPEPAPEPKPEPAPKPAEPEPVPEAKPEPVPVAKSEPVLKPKPAPEPKPVPPAPKPKKDVDAAFNALLAEGNKAISEQRFSEAIHLYKDALKLRPRASKVHKFLGIAYASQNNPAKACEHYRKYIELVPDAPDRAQVEQLISSCP